MRRTKTTGILSVTRKFKAYVVTDRGADMKTVLTKAQPKMTVHTAPAGFHANDGGEEKKRHNADDVQCVSLPMYVCGIGLIGVIHEASGFDL